VSRATQILRQVTAFLLLPNLPFWVTGHFYFTIPRSLFNVDYLIVGLLSLFLPPMAVVLLLPLVFLMDVLAGTISFFFFTEHDLFSSAQYVGEIQWQHSVLVGAILLAIALTVAVLVSKTAGTVSLRDRKLMAAVFGLLLVILTASRYRDSFHGPWLASSPAHRMLAAAWYTAFQQENRSSLAPAPSAAAQFLDGMDHSVLPVREPSQPHDIVLVLVESYGLMKNRDGAARLEAPFHAPAVLDKYELQTGAVEFQGPTVSGEFRELCGLKAEIGSSHLASKVSDKCLPKLLERKGYETTAIHGFMGVMFDRRTWYRELGFEHTWFLEYLGGLPGVHSCGGICPGICDADIARLLGQELAAHAGGKPQFFYWMTLNSHLPVPISSQPSKLMACGSANAADPDIDVCNWMVLIHRVNAAIAELSVQPRLRPTEFIVVGDHAPPFLSSRRRNQFSQEVVPYIHLAPKLASAKAKPDANRLAVNTPASE
jgi:hypothetical protein